MIEFISSWIKGLGLAIVIVSILEMLLPNSKMKKYIRMVMGIYVLFTMISPFLSDKELFNVNDLDIEEYVAKQTTSTVNQTSMEERIEKLYIQELEKDITKKLKEKGYQVTNCKVKAKISDKEEETKITKIKISAQKSQEEHQEQDVEKQMVVQIQKIKPIDTSLKKEKESKQEDVKVNKSDIQNIKKFLIEEYGVNEKCLEIN